MMTLGRLAPVTAENRTPLGQTLLLGFVQNLDSGHSGVIYDRLEGEIQLSLRTWLQVTKGFGDLVEASCLFENVKVVQQCFSVAHNFEDPAANASISGCSGAKIQFCKV
jgi:hypothetical protein